MPRKITTRSAAAVVVALVVVAGVIGIGVVALPSAGPEVLQTRIIGAPVCQGADSSGLEFTAETENVPFAAVTEANDGRGVVIRNRADTASDYDVVARLLPDNCLVSFEGFCIGEPVLDLSGGTALDQIWFKLPGKRGYVAGAVVQELPQGVIGKMPEECPGGLPAPTEISYEGPARTAEGAAALTFAASDAVTVGAAVRVDGGSRAWEQLGLDTTAGDGFRIPWTPPSGARSPAVVVFAACWAGNVPSQAVGSAVLGEDLRPRGTEDSDLREGASVACRQISGGA